MWKTKGRYLQGWQLLTEKLLLIGLPLPFTAQLKVESGRVR
ncbi:hypothetical protein [Liquorilactobacillus nagelii]|nr:hypothetical protein [Liquorilactobacillus nagelii]